MTFVVCPLCGSVPKQSVTKLGAAVAFRLMLRCPACEKGRRAWRQPMAKRSLEMCFEVPGITASREQMWRALRLAWNRKMRRRAKAASSQP